MIEIFSNDIITVVSGLPRSGTSMMMKMLQAGGKEILTDQIRTADDDNPEGYYEFEPVKQLKEGIHDWLPQARGKVVKIITALLTSLPPDYKFRVIFMQRAIPEVLASQRKMLIGRGKDADATPDAEMQRIFEKHLTSVINWMDHQPNLEYLMVNYNELLKQPNTHIKRINLFLGGEMLVDDMHNVIDPTLYRQRLSGRS